MKGQTYHPPAGHHARAVPFPLSKRHHHVELLSLLLASALGAVLILILAVGVTARD